MYLAENKTMVINIYHSLGRELLDQYLCREMAKLLHLTLNGRAKEFGTSDADLEFIINFYKHSFAGAMLDWIQVGLPGEVEDIVDLYVPLLKGTFDAILKRMALAH